MCLFIVCESEVTIGESRTISNANDTQAQQVALNPRPGRFSTKTPLERERRLQIQCEQQRRRRQQETAEQKEHRLVQQRQRRQQETEEQEIGIRDIMIVHCRKPIPADTGLNLSAITKPSFAKVIARYVFLVVTTLICYERLTQCSEPVKNRKKPICHFIRPDFWTNLNSCQQRLLFASQLTQQKIVPSARRVMTCQTQLNLTWQLHGNRTGVVSNVKFNSVVIPKTSQSGAVESKHLNI